MGSRRLGRKRLHSLDKQGQSLTAAQLGMGAGMSPALVRATQTREGLVSVIEIVLDLGTSKAAIASYGTENDIIGVDGVDSTLFDANDTTVFGRLLEVEMVCFETPTTGNDDLILTHHTAKISSNAANIDASAGTQSAVDNATWAIGESDRLTFEAQPGRYWTIVGGDTTAGTYDAGKFVIRVTGQIDPPNSDI
jgi:hypothetical protein